MSKIHILESDNKNSYKIVIHFDVIDGNNTVGHSWKSVGIRSGMTGSTILEVGTNPSNITQAEYDDIIAGDIVEVVKNITTGTATNIAVESLADIAITEYQQKMSKVLKYFGHII